MVLEFEGSSWRFQHTNQDNYACFHQTMLAMVRLQVVDEKEGPTTRREYKIAEVPVGQGLTGISTDFLGRLHANSQSQQLGSDQQLPLFNEQAPMEDREQIQEPLFTGLKVAS